MRITLSIHTCVQEIRQRLTAIVQPPKSAIKIDNVFIDIIFILGRNDKLSSTKLKYFEITAD